MHITIPELPATVSCESSQTPLCHNWCRWPPVIPNLTKQNRERLTRLSILASHNKRLVMKIMEILGAFFRTHIIPVHIVYGRRGHLAPVLHHPLPGGHVDQLVLGHHCLSVPGMNWSPVETKVGERIIQIYMFLKLIWLFKFEYVCHKNFKKKVHKIIH